MGNIGYTKTNSSKATTDKASPSAISLSDKRMPLSSAEVERIRNRLADPNHKTEWTTDALWRLLRSLYKSEKRNTVGPRRIAKYVRSLRHAETGESVKLTRSQLVNLTRELNFPPMKIERDFHPLTENQFYDMFAAFFPTTERDHEIARRALRQYEMEREAQKKQK